MQHVHVVESLDTFHDLAEEVARLLLREMPTYLPKFVQVSSVAVLGEQVEVVLSLLNVTQAYNMWGRNLAQNCNF
jgi:hypothetical protein